MWSNILNWTTDKKYFWTTSNRNTNCRHESINQVLLNNCYIHNKLYQQRHSQDPTRKALQAKHRTHTNANLKLWKISQPKTFNHKFILHEIFRSRYRLLETCRNQGEQMPILDTCENTQGRQSPPKHNCYLPCNILLRIVTVNNNRRFHWIIGCQEHRARSLWRNDNNNKITIYILQPFRLPLKNEWGNI